MACLRLAKAADSRALLIRLRAITTMQKMARRLCCLREVRTLTMRSPTLIPMSRTSIALRELLLARLLAADVVREGLVDRVVPVDRAVIGVLVDDVVVAAAEVVGRVVQDVPAAEHRRAAAEIASR